MNRLALPLLLAALAAASPAFAQSRADALEAWGEARAALAESRLALADARSKPAFRPTPAVIATQKLNEAAERMRSRPGTHASSLIHGLDAMKLKLQVVPRQAQPCTYTHTTRPGAVAITCSDSLASRSLSDVTLYLADCLAQQVLYDMPDSTEKDYLVISFAARAWIEMGGQVMSEPAMRARIQPWWDRAMIGNGSPSDYAPNGATRKSSLAELIAAKTAQQTAKQGEIDSYQKSFDRANCESEEQGWLNSITTAKDEHRRLGSEIRSLQEWQTRVKSYIAAEKTWLEDNNPTR